MSILCLMGHDWEYSWNLKRRYCSKCDKEQRIRGGCWVSHKKGS